MAKTDDAYSEYSLMNETFTSVEMRDAESLISERFNHKPIIVRDTKGRILSFSGMTVLDSEEGFYAYLVPLERIRGRKEGSEVLFEIDRTAVPFTMRAVTDDLIADSVAKTVSDGMDYQEYVFDNFREWLKDLDDDEPLRLMVRPDVSVAFKRLAVIERGTDVYAILEPMDHLELFDKDAEFVYRCDDGVSPPQFEPAKKEVCEDILAEYRKTLEKKKTEGRAAAPGKIVYDDFFEKSSYVSVEGEDIYDVLLGEAEDFKTPVTLRDEKGRDITFRIEAVYGYDFLLYAVLCPVTEIEGCDADTEILFFVDDELHGRVLRVETDERICDEIFDAVYDIFDDEEEILLEYPSLEDILCDEMKGFPVFCMGFDGFYYRFRPVFVDWDRPDEVYAVFTAMSSSFPYIKNNKYVFCLDDFTDTLFCDLEPEFDRKTINKIKKKCDAALANGASPFDVAYGGKRTEPVFRCTECLTKFRGDVCPKCGAQRKNTDSAEYPSCVYLSEYSEACCQNYVAWKAEKSDGKNFPDFFRCGGEPYSDMPCGLEFALSDEGFVVTGIGTCIAEYLGIPSEHEGKPVVGIEKSAFAKSPLKYVRVPGSVKFVGASAFEGCPRLEYVRFVSPLSEIEERTFAYCPKLSSVELPNGLEALGSFAFLGCESIKEIKIPVSVVSVEEGAFKDCRTLGSVYYCGDEEDWAKVEKDAGGNDALNCAEILFYSRDNPLRPGKFWHYSNENGSCRIKWKACSEPAKDCRAFSSNDYLPTYGLEYEETEDGYVVTGRGDCEEKDIVIPGTHLGKKVIALGNGAFKNDAVIRNIVVPEGVGKIGASAFRGCKNLKTAVILGDVKKIEDETFCECGDIVSVVIPGSCKEMGKHVFDCCYDPAIFFKGDRTLWNGVDIDRDDNELLSDDDCVYFYSEERAKPVKRHWHYTEKFKPVRWKGTGDTDGVIKYPFDPAVNLPREEVLFGEAEEEKLAHGLEYQRLGKCCAVAGTGSCTDLENVVLPSMYNGLNVTKIGIAAFKGRTDMKFVSIPDGVTAIDDEAFSGCDGLCEIELPASVEKIGVSAFENCKKLFSADLGERITAISLRAFSGCASLEYVVLPSLCHGVGACAFEGCNSLKAVFIPLSAKEHEKFMLDVDETGNRSFLNATMYVYSGIRPETPGNFWHYGDDGKPVTWDK
ncbi:MAG: leucine-rich repeat domain-containing protein [Clostridia bacterium]|nr:leucine-rich repeat domain-containing protein [Clostridia bacterium]